MFNTCNVHNKSSVCATGTFDELLQQGGHFAQLIAQFQSEAEEQEKEAESGTAAEDEHFSNNENTAAPVVSSSLLDVNKAEATKRATAPNPPLTPQVSFAGVQPPQSQISVEEAHDRTASESYKRGYSSTSHFKQPVIPMPSSDKGKLMTEEVSASGAHYE